MSNNQSLSTLIWLILGATLTGCNGSNYSDTTSDTSTQSQSLTSLAMVNKSAYIPPQCYTKTIDNEGAAHNPCYTCHLPSDEPN